MAKGDVITVSHLSDRNSIYEPMRDNMFELVVEGLGNLVRSGSTTNEKLPYDNDQAGEYVRIAVNKLNIPDFTIGVMTIKRGNMAMKAAGTMEFSQGDMELIDYVNLGATSILRAWRNLAGDPRSEKVGRMKDYKKSAELIEYTCDHEVVRRWKVEGAWISEVKDPQWNHEGGNDKRVVTATLVFDKTYIVEDRSIEGNV